MSAPALSPLPVGYQRFHRNPFVNYQLNRTHAEGYAREDDLKQAAAKIADFDDYVRELLAQADRAEREGRLQNAAAYVRSAEFFTPHRSPRKRAVYERFADLFDRAFAGEGVERVEVPFGESALPTSILRARGGSSHGTVLFHGGFDSLVEEFFCIWARLADAGFDVIAFDGPGQGGARALHGHVFDHDWEKPVRAILDHFELDQVTLIGMSMGGYWALRAAAFEPRVTRVIAWPPVYDWLVQLPGFVRPLVRWMLAWPGFLRWSIRLRARLSSTLRHIVAHTLYIQGDSQDPVDVVRWFLAMNARHLHSERVHAHVLLLCGENDGFQPPKLMRAQVRALTQAASVTTRVFTAQEHADQHCQMGNLELATRVATEWLVSGPGA